MKPTELDHVTCAFGVKGSWAAGYHTGVDYRAAVGTPIYATKGGTIVHSGYGGWGSAYGLHVIIESSHKGRRVQHLYAHLSKSSVESGQVVRVGHRLGFSGETGNTNGPHLHYEERLSPFSYWNHYKPVLPAWKPLYRPTVRLSKLLPGKKNRSVRIVQRRLNRRFPDNKLKVNGVFDKATERKYREWQRHLEYRGPAADGIPGRSSLEKLALRVKP